MRSGECGESVGCVRLIPGDGVVWQADWFPVNHPLAVLWQHVDATPAGAAIATNLNADDLNEAAAELMTRGVRVERLSFKQCQRAGTMITIAKVLGFPSYFGENWMAFDECIGDREFQPRVATALIMEDSFRVLRVTRGAMLRIFESIQDGSAASNYAHMPEIEFPPLWVVLNFLRREHMGPALEKFPRILRAVTEA